MVKGFEVGSTVYKSRDGSRRVTSVPTIPRNKLPKTIPDVTTNKLLKTVNLIEKRTTLPTTTQIPLLTELQPEKSTLQIDHMPEKSTLAISLPSLTTRNPDKIINTETSTLAVPSQSNQVITSSNILNDIPTESIVRDPNKRKNNVAELVRTPVILSEVPCKWYHVNKLCINQAVLGKEYCNSCTWLYAICTTCKLSLPCKEIGKQLVRKTSDALLWGCVEHWTQANDCLIRATNDIGTVEMSVMISMEEQLTQKYLGSVIEQGVTAASSLIRWSDKASDTLEVILASHKLNHCVAIHQGDITKLHIQAIVNAAKPSLMGGGGVDGAIHKAAGPELLRECTKMKGCRMGEAKLAWGHLLPAKHVIITVGPKYDSLKPAVSEELLSNCYYNVLELARDNNITQVAFCGISTGFYSYPLEQATEVAVQTVRQWLITADNANYMDLIVFCTHESKQTVMYQRSLETHFPRQGFTPAQLMKCWRTVECKDDQVLSMLTGSISKFKSMDTNVGVSIRPTDRINQSNDVPRWEDAWFTSMDDIMYEGVPYLRFHINLENGFQKLSNSAKHLVSVSGVMYSSVDQYMLIMKFPNYPELQKQILSTKDMHEAKSLCENSRYKPDPEWDAKKERVMVKMLRAKFLDRELAQILRKTNKARLIDASTNAEWGEGCFSKGRNRLGQILEQIRTWIGPDTEPTQNFILEGERLQQPLLCAWSQWNECDQYTDGKQHKQHCNRCYLLISKCASQLHDTTDDKRKMIHMWQGQIPTCLQCWGQMIGSSQMIPVVNLITEESTTTVRMVSQLEVILDEKIIHRYYCLSSQEQCYITLRDGLEEYTYGENHPDNNMTYLDCNLAAEDPSIYEGLDHLRIAAVLDGGASINVIPPELVEMMQIPTFAIAEPILINNINGGNTECVRTCVIYITMEGESQEKLEQEGTNTMLVLTGSKTKLTLALTCSIMPGCPVSLIIGSHAMKVFDIVDTKRIKAITLGNADIKLLVQHMDEKAWRSRNAKSRFYAAVNQQLITLAQLDSDSYDQLKEAVTTTVNLLEDRVQDGVSTTPHLFTPEDQVSEAVTATVNLLEDRVQDGVSTTPHLFTPEETTYTNRAMKSEPATKKSKRRSVSKAIKNHPSVIENQTGNVYFSTLMTGSHYINTNRDTPIAADWDDTILEYLRSMDREGMLALNIPIQQYINEWHQDYAAVGENNYWAALREDVSTSSATIDNTVYWANVEFGEHNKPIDESQWYQKAYANSDVLWQPRDTGIQLSQSDGAQQCTWVQHYQCVDRALPNASLCQSCAEAPKTYCFYCGLLTECYRDVQDDRNKCHVHWTAVSVDKLVGVTSQWHQLQSSDFSEVEVVENESVVNELEVSEDVAVDFAEVLYEPTHINVLRAKRDMRESTLVTGQDVQEQENLIKHISERIVAMQQLASTMGKKDKRAKQGIYKLINHFKRIAITQVVKLKKQVVDQIAQGKVKTPGVYDDWAQDLKTTGVRSYSNRSYNANCRHSRLKKMYLAPRRRSWMTSTRTKEEKDEDKLAEHAFLRHSRLFKHSIKSIEEEHVSLQFARQARGMQEMMMNGMLPKYDCYNMEQIRVENAAQLLWIRLDVLPYQNISQTPVRRPFQKRKARTAKDWEIARFTSNTKPAFMIHHRKLQAALVDLTRTTGRWLPFDLTITNAARDQSWWVRNEQDDPIILGTTQTSIPETVTEPLCEQKVEQLVYSTREYKWVRDTSISEPIIVSKVRFSLGTLPITIPETGAYSLCTGRLHDGKKEGYKYKHCVFADDDDAVEQRRLDTENEYKHKTDQYDGTNDLTRIIANLTEIDWRYDSEGNDWQYVDQGPWVFILPEPAANSYLQIDGEDRILVGYQSFLRWAIQDYILERDEQETDEREIGFGAYQSISKVEHINYANRDGKVCPSTTRYLGKGLDYQREDVNWSMVNQRILQARMESINKTHEFSCFVTLEENLNEGEHKPSCLTYLDSEISATDRTTNTRNAKHRLALLVDGGASINVITPEMVKFLNIPTREVSFPVRIRNAGGGITECNRRCKVYVTIDGEIQGREFSEKAVPFNNKKLTLAIDCTVMKGCPVPIILGSNAMDVFHIVDDKTEKVTFIGSGENVIKVSHMTEVDWKKNLVDTTIATQPGLGPTQFDVNLLDQERTESNFRNSIRRPDTPLLAVLANLLKNCHLDSPLLDETELLHLDLNEIPFESIHKLARRLTLSTKTTQRLVAEVENYRGIKDQTFNPVELLAVTKSKEDSVSVPRTLWRRVVTMITDPMVIQKSLSDVAMKSLNGVEVIKSKTQSLWNRVLPDSKSPIKPTASVASLSVNENNPVQNSSHMNRSATDPDMNWRDELIQDTEAEAEMVTAETDILVRKEFEDMDVADKELLMKYAAQGEYVKNKDLAAKGYAAPASYNTSKAKMWHSFTKKQKLLFQNNKELFLNETSEEEMKRLKSQTEEAIAARLVIDEALEKERVRLYQDTVANKLNIRAAIEATRVVLEEWGQPIDDDITSLSEDYTLNEDETDKPELFPSQLWKYVADNIKPLVKQRWSKFDADRIAEVVKDLDKVDICPERPASLPYVKAQCFANIDVYYHVDELNVPYVPGFEMRIHTTDELPVIAKSYKRHTFLERIFLDLKTEDLQQRKILELSESNFRSPVMLVEYPERVKAFMEEHFSNIEDALMNPLHRKVIMTFFRFTMNFVMLNEKTIPDQHPMPNLKDVVESFSQATHYSCGDVADAFWIVALAKQDRHKTAFATHNKLLQWRCSVQGSKNAAVFFARMIATVFAKAGKGISVYQDDIFNHTIGIKSHLLMQEETYDRMRKHCLVFKMSKARLNYPRLKILGHVITRDGRAPDPAKIQAILDLAEPTTPKGIRELVGMVQFNAEYIHELSSILAPLNDIMHDDCDVRADWKDEIHGAAFRKIKQCFINAPLLAMPELFKVYRIFVDTCTTHGRGIGAILCQWHGKTEYDPLNTDVTGEGWRPVAYWSKLLNASQRKYSATEAEAKGLHDAILHWSPYLKIGQFEVVVDHKALEYIFNTNNITANRRILHYALDLQGYNYRVLYKNGKEHLNADGLSRLYRYEDKLDDEQQPGVNFDTVTANDIRLLADKLKLDEEYLQSLITKDEVNDTHAYVNFTTIEEESEAKSKFNEMVRLKREELAYFLKTNIAMMNDKEYMSMKDNFPDDEDDESDPYDDYDRLTPPNSDETFNREYEAYMTMHCVYDDPEEVNSGKNAVNELLSKQCSESEHCFKAECVGCCTTSGYCASSEYCSSGVQNSKADYRLSRIDEDEIQYVDPMIVNYVNLDLATVENEEDDSEPTHRRIHNLMDGTVTYESLIFTTIREDYVLANSRETPTFNINKSSLRQRHGRVVETPVITPMVEDPIEDLVPTDLDGINDLLYDVEVASSRKSIKSKQNSRTIAKSKSKQNSSAVTKSKSKRVSSSRQVSSSIADVEPIRDAEVDAQIVAEKLKTSQMRKDSQLKRLAFSDTSKAAKRDQKIETLRLQQVKALQKQRSSQLVIEERDTRVIAARAAKLKENIQKAEDRKIARLIERGNSKALVKQIKDAEHTRRVREAGPKLIATNRKDKYPEYAYETVDQQNIREAGEIRARQLSEKLVGSVYQHASTSRIYEVIAVFWDDVTASIAAYRQPADGEVSTSGDLQGWMVEGIGGVEEAVAIYNEFAGVRSKDSVRWPQSEQEMRVAQMTDPYLVTVIDNIEKGIPQYTNAGKQFYIPILADGAKGALRVQTERLTDRNEGKTVIEAFSDIATALPKSLVSTIMRFYHGSMGHPGLNRMEDSLRLKYWWVGIRESCTFHCNKCLICKLRKVDSRPGLLPTKRYPMSLRPCQRMHFDLIGPLTRTDNGYCYILVAKCPLTQWIEVVPLMTKGMIEVTEAITNHILSVHGSIETIITDNGKEFIGTVPTAIDYLLNNKHKLTTSYHAAANGEVENQNRTLKDMLACYTNENHTDWDKFLPIIVHAYRTTVNTATGFSPFRALRGYEARQPSEQWIQDFKTTSQVSITQYVNKLTEALLWTWETAGYRIRKNQETLDNCEPDKRVRLFRPFRVGEMFFMKSIPKRFLTDEAKKKWKLTQKLQHRYTGPHKVIEVKSPVVYKCLVNGKEKMVWAGKMKRDPASNKPFEAFEDDIVDLEQDIEPEYDDFEQVIAHRLINNDQRAMEEENEEYDFDTNVDGDTNVKLGVTVNDSEEEILEDEIEDDEVVNPRDFKWKIQANRELRLRQEIENEHNRQEEKVARDFELRSQILKRRNHNIIDNSNNNNNSEPESENEASIESDSNSDSNEYGEEEDYNCDID